MKTGVFCYPRRSQPLRASAISPNRWLPQSISTRLAAPARTSSRTSAKLASSPFSSPPSSPPRRWASSCSEPAGWDSALPCSASFSVVFSPSLAPGVPSVARKILLPCCGFARSYSPADLRRPVRPNRLVGFHLAPALVPLRRPDPDDALPSGDPPARACEVRDLSRLLSNRDRRCPHLLHILLSPGATDVARRCAPA